jgi:2,3-bisphosphoglycerate-independent phosphoglycerate mutase
LGQTAIPAVYIHCFMDGRDTSPTGGIEYVRTLQAHCREAGAGQIATLIGRYYAMDRDQRWERIKKAYDLLVHGKGTPYESPAEALSVSYKAGLTDEFIEPTVITEGGAPVAQIEEEDAVLFFNFRTDRGRELTTVLTQEARPAYDMQPLPLHYTTLTEYDRTFEGVNVLFQPQSLNDTMGEVLAREGASQLRIAETEKYAHVTFFFNGGQETQYEGESRELIPSPKVATYDQQPAMSAEEVRQRVRDYIQGVHGPAPDFICLNYANPDMVGHTGDMTAAIQACETVDRCVADTVAAARAAGYTTLILADHGNADRMRKPDGSPHTAHTTALVPMIAIPPDDQTQLMVRGGKLGDVAPTLLSLMGIEVPAAMTGEIIVRQLEASMR